MSHAATRFLVVLNAFQHPSLPLWRAREDTLRTNW
jgi:hypothetical protein